MCGFCNVWVCVYVGFVMCWCFGNMCICIYCVFVLFLYVYLFLFVTSVRLLPLSENSIAVNNNNNNNNNNNCVFSGTLFQIQIGWKTPQKISGPVSKRTSSE